MSPRADGGQGGEIVQQRAAVLVAVLAVAAAVTAEERGGARRGEAAVRLMTLDPGHFHAALVQKEMQPEIAETVHVYAPLGPDLLAHLGRIAGFNQRATDPTRWQLEVH